jgi:putative endonuclease
LSSLQKQLPNFIFGQAGENRAAHFLLSHGFLVIDQNVQIGADEIDIVAVDMNLAELVFVEVKARSGEEFGEPSRAVGWRKMRAIRRGAEKYLRIVEREGKRVMVGNVSKQMVDMDYRFDILAVLPNSITHYQNVTWRMVK